MSATTNRVGVLKSNVPGGTGLVRIRTNPSLSASYVSKPIGTRVTVLVQTGADTDGHTWYQVQYDGTKAGWVRDDVITILPDTPTPTPTPTPDPSIDDTRLYFETDTRVVRVFDAGSAVLMNVYNKMTKQTEVNRVPATKLPINASSQESFIATQSGRTYQASFVRRGSTQLRITDSATGQDVVAIESGFGARGTDYQRSA